MTSKPSTLQKILTDDGSPTCRHPLFGEPYHALQGARTEAEHKFILPSRLMQRLRNAPVRLLDVGFGLGVNCRAAAHTAQSLHAYPLILETLEADPEAWGRARELYPECPLTRSLAETGRFESVSVQAIRHDGDLRQTLPSLPGAFDLIFHDPFSPLKNTECWTLEVFRLLFEHLNPDGLLLTYSESSAVRAGLLHAGFHIGITPAVPPHRGGTQASPRLSNLTSPLDPAPFQQFPKTIPFRDPSLTDSGREIRARREATIRARKHNPC